MDNIENTKKEVEKNIRKWYEAATVMNLETFMELASDNFVLHNPGRAINGKREFEEFFHECARAVDDDCYTLHKAARALA